ncbi:ATP cone domain-containing protein, partial [Clostridium perfringens]|uniref:ATP cone domain-containing protein n=1 Tax=Clostridium perfringens TaxID=1502 RepID=UPI003754DB61
KRFTNYEKVETVPLVVIKKDNNREPYDRNKIQDGILRSCHKRPVSVNTMTRIVDEIETRIFNMDEKETPTTIIGEMVMDKLKDVDAVVYVRFA